LGVRAPARDENRFADAGLTLAVIETGFPWLHHAKLGIDGPEREAETVRAEQLIANLGAIGVPIVCWNWMAGFNWIRTSTTTPTRGGDLVTSYDHDLMRQAPLTEAGEVADERLWQSLHRFMERIVPAAEAAGVRLALHPDDPPISPIRGMTRILRSPEAMQRALALVPSPVNGVTFCQGTFATMGADIATEIRDLAAAGALHFVHFRDVRGTSQRFTETLHDDGQPDMGTRCGPTSTWVSTALCAPTTCRRWPAKKTSPPATTSWADSSRSATSRGSTRRPRKRPLRRLLDAAPQSRKARCRRPDLPRLRQGSQLSTPSPFLDA
jgi:mannonate dehydratase